EQTGPGPACASMQPAGLLGTDGVRTPDVGGSRGPRSHGPVLGIVYSAGLRRVVPGDRALRNLVAGSRRGAPVREGRGAIGVEVGHEYPPVLVGLAVLVANGVVGGVVGEHQAALPVVARVVVAERAARRVGDVHALAQVVVAVVVADRRADDARAAGGVEGDPVVGAAGGV